ADLRYPMTQVSMVVRDLDSTMERYHRAFGWAPWLVFDHVPPVHHNTQLRGRPVHYALRGAEVYVGSLNFELLQPLQGPNLWSEFIDRRGEGVASIATMFLERGDGDAVKVAFRDQSGIEVKVRWAESVVGDLNLELIEPLGPGNRWHEFLETRGEGISSIAVMFETAEESERVKRQFAAGGIGIAALSHIGDHIEWYFLDA